MVNEDSDINLYAFCTLVFIVALLLYRYLTEIQKFEHNTKTFFLSIFTLSNALIIFSVFLVFFMIKKLVDWRRNKIIRKELGAKDKMFEKERLKEKRIAREKAIKEKAESKRLEEIQLKQLQEKYPIRKVKLKESKIEYGRKVYLEKDCDEADIAFLTSEGFIHVREKSLDEKAEYYLVFNDNFESPKHIILVKEIVDYLKRFTKDIETYRTAMPDIVFEANENKWAIEVETGSILKDKPKIKNKVELCNKRFGSRWFFFVTNRNLEKEYAKFGKVSTKRNIKSIIEKIFKNSEK